MLGKKWESEQERKFEQTMEKKCWRILFPAGIMLALFQIYNIVFTLCYTDFRLHTRASRVYMVFYVFLFLLIAVLFVVKLTIGKKGRSKEHLCLMMYQWCGLIFLFWSACVSVYDQRVSDNVSVYMGTAVSVAVLVYMKPSVSIPGYFFVELLMIIGMLRIHQGNFSDHYGAYVNSAMLTVTAVFISVYRYRTMRSDFRKQELIEEKNREILRKSEALDYLANHDTLTGLWNRRFLEHCLNEKFRENGSEHSAVLMIDVDHFKQYNDRYGHQKGDECLQRVAGAIDLAAGKGKLFRYGGEEFLCLLAQPQTDEAEKLGEEICRYVERLAIPAAAPEGVVTVSVGWAEGRAAERESFEELMAEADRALYRAKQTGRNRVEGSEIDSVDVL